MSLTGVKRITVYPNGDRYHQGARILVNNRQTDMDVLMTNISEKVYLPNGAKKLYTTSGHHIKKVAELEDGKSYVASSTHFTPEAYGGVMQPKKISRTSSEEPIKRSRSQTAHSKERSNGEAPKKRSASTAPGKLTEEKKKVKKKKPKPKSEDDKENVEKKAKKVKKSVKKKKKPVKEVEEKDNKNEGREIVIPFNHREAVEDEIKQKPIHRPKTGMPRTDSEIGMAVVLLNADDSSSDREVELPSRLNTASTSRSGKIRSESETDHERESSEHEEAQPGTRTITPHSRRASVAKPDSRRASTNWGDLSSFTKNIDSLLKK